MTQALTYIYQIFNKFVQLMFNDFEMFSGVTVGWVIVSVMLFNLMIVNILNLPRSVKNAK